MCRTPELCLLTDQNAHKGTISKPIGHDTLLFLRCGEELEWSSYPSYPAFSLGLYIQLHRRQVLSCCVPFHWNSNEIGLTSSPTNVALSESFGPGENPRLLKRHNRQWGRGKTDFCWVDKHIFVLEYTGCGCAPHKSGKQGMFQDILTMSFIFKQNKAVSNAVQTEHIIGITVPRRPSYSCGRHDKSWVSFPCHQ